MGAASTLTCRTLAILVAALALGSGPAGATAAAEGGSLDELRDRIARLLGPRTPGAGVALVGRRGTIWVGGIGVADLSTRRPVTADTLFRLASVAKSVTALALMRLVEQGRLSLDARLRDVAPEVEFENAWEATHPVRVSHLLEHTAGFDQSHFNEQWDDHPYPRPLRALLAVNPAARRARWPPGTRMSYSNENYLVAGYLIEKVSGRSYDDFVADAVFLPLAMRGARFWLSPEARPLLAQGYGNGKPIRDEEQMIRPAVNLIASAQDMSRYLSFWLARGAIGVPPLLSPAGIERIESCRTLAYRGPEQRYGLGNALDQIEGYVAHGHLGIYESFMASFRYFPREGVGWALLFNSTDEGTRLAVEREVLHFLMLGQPPVRVPAVPVPAENLRRLAGSYRSAAPPYQVFAFASSLDIVDVDEEAGVLFERPFRQQGLFQRLLRGQKVELVPVGPGAFREAGGAVSNRLFLQAVDGTEAMVTPDGYLEKVPRALASLQRDLFFCAILALLSAPVFALFWVSRFLLGRAPWPAHVSARLVPLIASLCFFAVYTVLSRSPQRWGRFNVTTLSVCLLTWAFALLAIAALYAAVKAPRDVLGRWVKLHSIAVGAAACALAVYFWRARWIGIQLWKW